MIDVTKYEYEHTRHSRICIYIYIHIKSCNIKIMGCITHAMQGMGWNY